MKYPLIVTEIYYIEDFNERDASCLRCDAKSVSHWFQCFRGACCLHFPVVTPFGYPQNESTKNNQDVCTCIPLRTESYSESFESSLLTL
jgi:3-phenylpropionate/cinnamic acid dioxygenase small subunit